LQTCRVQKFLRLDHLIGAVLKVKFMAFDPHGAHAVPAISAIQIIRQAPAAMSKRIFNPNMT
jgi:hypothetical protein